MQRKCESQEDPITYRRCNGTRRLHLHLHVVIFVRRVDYDHFDDRRRKRKFMLFWGSGGKIKRKEIKNGGTEINSCGLKDVRKDLFSDSWCVQS